MPKSMVLLTCVLLAALAISSFADDLTAVIEVNGHEWLETRPPYLAALTNYYAPHPVFFEGWKSSPREEIESYVWDFGDGSDTFSGFNAAHVYETPGTYTVTLTVTRKAEPGETPQTATATIGITVNARDGDTYYVDSDIGNDAYNGLSATVEGEGVGPWATATKAFEGMTNQGYGQGDQILFKRGQTFDLELDAIFIPHWGAGDGGYLFGAYGEGDKPIVKAVEPEEEPASRSMIRNYGVGTRFVSLVDLEFDCTPDGEDPGAFWNSGTGGGAVLLFLRVDVKNCTNAYLLGQTQNIFLVDCTTYNSTTVQIYCEHAITGRWAMLGNTWDYSGNHIGYLNPMHSAVISGNTFSRPAYGRCALRIAGGSPDAGTDASNVWVCNNKFLGWADPRTGDRQYVGGNRYNYGLLEFMPNSAGEDFGEWLVFENNLVTDAENLMSIACWEHVFVRNNTFITQDYYYSYKMFIGGRNKVEERPVLDIQITDNIFSLSSAAQTWMGVIDLLPYVGPEYMGRSFHEDVVIKRNVFLLPYTKSQSSIGQWSITLPSDPSLYVGLNIDNNLIYSPDDSHPLWGTSDTWKALGRDNSYNLHDWRTLTGHDSATQICEDFDKPVPGWARSPETLVDGPIPVVYERAIPMMLETATAQAGGEKRITLTAGASATNGFYVGRDIRIADGLGAEHSGAAQGATNNTITLAATASSVNNIYNNRLILITSNPGIHQVQRIVAYDGTTKVATVLQDWGTLPTTSDYVIPAEKHVITAYDGATKVATVGVDWNTQPDHTSVYEITGAGSEIAEVALWARYEDGPWTDTGLRTSGTSGSFSYPAAEGAGTYYFATQAIDTAGNVSLPPVGPGATKTYYTGGAPLDTTAPNPGVVSAPASATTSPITVTYADAADEAGGSGLNEVELWVKKASVGLWNPTGLKQTGSSGSFNYSVSVSGIETFYFDTRAEDNAGNISALPSGDGQASTVFGEIEGDIIPPTAGTVDAPGVTNASPITVSYSGVADEGGSGLKQVVLWAKVNGGSWLSTGMTNTAASGSFAYTPAAGDAQYAFALRAEDNAGNLSAAPSGDGVPCLYDVTVPTIGSMTSPLYAKATPIAVSYSDVSDGSGSGLRKVYFWFRKDGGAWVDSGLSQTTASGTFNTSPGQAGTYEYALRVEDIAGNLSPQPSGAGQTTTILDMAAPVLGTLTAPSEDSSPPISVVYSGVEDDLSGLKLVYLWFRKGAGAWQNSGLASSAASGSFAFNGMTGNDTYYFAMQAEDNAGNLTPVPTGDGTGSTVYDTDFSAGTAASPQYATALPIIVTYSGTTESENGLKLVRLWYKHGSDGVWTDSGLTSTGLSGQFEFSVNSEDGSYYFALQAENNEGGLTPGPPYGDGDTQTIYDTTPPNPGNMASPEYTKETPIVITYSGASDAASGLKEVRLWFKKGYAGAWEDTGQRSTTPEGTFTFTDVTGDDAYFFFLQAEDNAGHVSAEPTDELVFGGG